MYAPKLTFFCELELEPLEQLLSQPQVLAQLSRLRAGVSLGLLDLSPERAAMVRRLHEAGVPVTAWMLLPLEQGYFQSVDNAEATSARFDTMLAWTRREGLVWQAIGLDIELDRRDLERFARQPWRAVPATLARAFDGRRLQRGLDAYQALIARMRAEGFRVETYQFPWLEDERRAGSRLLQRACGLMDLPVDREVWMLYSSLLPSPGDTRRGPGWLCSYGPQAQAIAVGSTGGGIDTLPKLGWNELKRDLLLARAWTDELYIFSLEGCIAQDLLPRLEALDWSEAADRQACLRDRRRVDLGRRALRLGLELSARVERAAASLRGR